MRKISKITVRHLTDTDPDTSFLGEFSNSPKGEFPIQHDGGPREYQYFNPEGVENIEQTQENYERMLLIDSGQVGFIGIRAEAEILTSQDGKTWKRDTITSGGLWGIESDSGEDYPAEVAGEEITDLTHTLMEFGFTESEIAEAPVIQAE